jgi:hypothetical protein
MNVEEIESKMFEIESKMFEIQLGYENEMQDL